MIFIQVLIALVIAIIITLIFYIPFKIKGPWQNFWSFFIIIFFGNLAAGTLVETIGSSIYGFYWIPGIFMGLIIALLLAAVTPVAVDQKRKSKFDKIDYNKEEPGDNPRSADIHSIKYADEERSLSIGLFYWIVVVLLILAAVTGMIN